MGQVIGLLAQESPKRPAVTHEGRTLSRLELERRTNRLARAYAALGVGQDDLVPIPARTPRWWKAPTSGGSTGRPKIIVAEQPGLADPDEPPFLMQRHGTQLVPGPLYHNGPFAFSTRGLLSGNHIVVMTRFDPSLTLELIERHRVDWVLMVPTMMHRIWRLPEEERVSRDLASLRVVLHLAAPCPPWLKEAWIGWLGPERIHELYAGTEAQGATWITGG